MKILFTVFCLILLSVSTFAQDYKSPATNPNYGYGIYGTIRDGGFPLRPPLFGREKIKSADISEDGLTVIITMEGGYKIPIATEGNFINRPSIDKRKKQAQDYLERIKKGESLDFRKCDGSAEPQTNESQKYEFLKFEFKCNGYPSFGRDVFNRPVTYKMEFEEVKHPLFPWKEKNNESEKNGTKNEKTADKSVKYEEQKENPQPVNTDATSQMVE